MDDAPSFLPSSLYVSDRQHARNDSVQNKNQEVSLTLVSVLKGQAQFTGRDLDYCSPSFSICELVLQFILHSPQNWI